MKKIYALVIGILIMTNLRGQNWIPKGEGKLFDGVAVMSMSLVGDSVIWMTTSSWAVVYAQMPVPLTHLIRVMRSVDAGETWQSLSIPESIGRISFDILGISRDTAWITTQDIESGRGRALMKTVDGGDTWKQIFLHRSAGGYLRAFDQQHLICQSNKYVSTSSDGGLTWSSDTLTLYDQDEYNLLVSGSNMASVIGDTVWVGTDKGRVFRTTNFGTSHSITQATPPGYTILCISFENHLQGMLMYYYDNFTKYGLMRTFDGGATWENTPKIPASFISCNLTHVKGAPGTYILTPDSYSTNQLYFYTKNFGETWTTGGIIAGANCNSVQFHSPETGWLSAGFFDNDSVRYTGYKWASDLFSSLKNPETPALTFEIFPNPARNILQYSSPDLLQIEHDVSVLHPDGRIIISRKTSSNELDISALPNGLYFLQVATDKVRGLQEFIKTSD